MPDRHFMIAMRLKHRSRHIEPSARATCLNSSRCLGVCGKQLDSEGRHALKCPRGGGTVTRHHAIRNALQRWIKGCGVQADREQEVPHWERTNRRGEKERAYLDVVYTESGGAKVHIDTTVTDLASLAERGGAAWKHGLARREQTKHLRYPGPTLVPFVLDVRGRWGREATAWFKGFLRKHVAEEDRSEKAKLGRWMVAEALQNACATQVTTAMGR